LAHFFFVLHLQRVGRISVFMVDNLNAFGVAGGFEYIAARLSILDRPAELGHIIMLLEPLIMVRTTLHSSALRLLAAAVS
jgi:hypothetical protein